MFFKTSNVGRKDISNKVVNNKNVSSINIGSKENYNKKKQGFAYLFNLRHNRNV
jgi:hypothetical protein